MKILFVTRLFYPHVGGVEKHIFEISKRMVQDGHSVTIITENNAWRSNETIDGITIYRMDVSPDDRWKKFRIWRKIASQITLLWQSDIIHCHDVFFWYLPFRFIFIDKPVYTTFHGYETVYPPTKKAIIIRKLSEKLSYGMICIGDYISKWYGTKPTIVSYGGISQDSIRLTNKISFQTKLTIFFIGRLEKDTGLPLYLQSLDILNKKHIPYRFEVFGDGSLRSIAEKYGMVHGFVPTFSKLIKQGNLVFASSYLAILEAIAMKSQIYAIYDNPLKQDYLLMTPFANWITIEDSPIKLVDKILANQKQKQKTRENIDHATTWVKTQTWENLVKQYYSLWKI